MKKTMKKILAVVLVFVMAVSAVVPAFAADAKCPGANKDHFKDNCASTKIDTYAPKCGERGYTVYQCNECKKYFADDFVENKEQHKYEQTKAPTCTEPGEQKCSKCGHPEPVDALGHDWKNVDPNAKPCGKPGTLIEQKCSRCGETRTIDAGDNHKWSIKVEKEPICGADGLAKYTCDVCGYVKDVVIEHTSATTSGHKWVFVEAVEKTCEKDGNTAGYVCANEGCDAVAPVGSKITTTDKDGKEIEVTVESKYEVLKAGHSYGDQPTLTYEATCVTPQYYMYVCTVCGDAYMDNDLDKDGEVDVPALGHNIDMTQATTKVTNCKIDDNGKFVAGKTVVTGPCTRCPLTAVTETTEHEYESEDVEATCQVGAYTVYTCENGCAVVTTEPGDPDPKAHDMEVTPVNAPTCLKPGTGIAVCQVPDCDHSETNVEIPALNHSYMIKGEDGKYSYDYTKGVYNCATGNWEFTCTRDVCDAEEDVEKVAIEGFDKDDYTDHKSWEDGEWTGDIDPIKENTCGKASFYNYICECGYTILVTVPSTHTKPTGWVNNAVPAKCNTDGNYAWFICAEEGCGAYCYINAAGIITEIPNAEGKKTPELLADGITPKAVVIAKTGCDIVIDKVYIAGVCGGEDGQTAGWHCTHAADGLCDATANADDSIAKDAAGRPMVKAGDEKKLTGSSTSVVIHLTHAFPPVNNRGNATVVETQKQTCDQYGYNCYQCANCDAYIWYDYTGISGHKIETKPATCTEDGYEVCVNPWCQHRDAKTNELVLSSKNPTWKEIDAKGHTDEKGNPIVCVAEDFWCAVCRPEKVEKEDYADTVKEEDKEYIDNPLGKLDHTESHNTAHGDSVAIKNTYGSLAKFGGMIPTKLDSHDCTKWGYILYVCPDCKDDSKGGYFTDDQFEPCKEHTIVDGKNTYTKATAVATIPEKFFTVTKVATFAAAGVKSAKCTCPLCDGVVATKEYIREDIGFDIKVDSAIKSGADIVDSGKINVDILVNAYDVDVYSILFDLSYNPNHLEFVEAKLPEGSPFGESGVSAAANNGEVTVYLANYGEKLANIDFKLAGKQMAVVTLVFEVKNVNAVGQGKTDSNLALNDISVLYITGNSKEPVKSVAVANNGTNSATSSILSEKITIYALGNVTKGVIENKDTRIDDFDALNWQGLFIDDKYDAAADINKNGQLDAHDYEYICQYIVGAFDYNELCAK